MIRLTLITLAALVSAMYIWGTDDPNASTNEITATVIDDVEATSGQQSDDPLTALVQTSLSEPVEEDDATPVVETATIEPVAEEETVEVAQLETVDLSTPKPANTLIVLESNDAPADALPLTPVATNEADSAPTQTDDKTILVVTGSRVNLRAGPSTNNQVVISLSRGQEAELIASASDGWLEIRHLASGRVGFMSGDFLRPLN